MPFILPLGLRTILTSSGPSAHTDTNQSKSAQTEALEYHALFPHAFVNSPTYLRQVI